LKLFRDYLFHQVTENGAPWVDLAHIVACLNKVNHSVNHFLKLFLFRAMLENSERSVRGVRMGKSGPLERAQSISQSHSRI